MPLRTADQFANVILSDLSWRRKEVRVISNLVSQHANTAKQQAILRGSIASLYAHWEGGVKIACNTYAEYLRNKRPNFQEMNAVVIAGVLRRRFVHLGTNGTTEELAQLLDDIRDESPRRLKIPSSFDFSAQSNLSSIVLKKICFDIGVEYLHDFAVSEKMIDELVHMRNQLAHGDWLRLDHDDFPEFVNLIDRLLYLFSDLLIDFVSHQRYLRGR